MATLTDKAILSGVDNRPPMLEKEMYDSWNSKMKLYMMNRQHGRMILESIKNGPLTWPLIEENGVTRPKKYSELSATEAIQADCDVKATNIILQGLPPEERECKLYDEFDKFVYKKGETLRDFYLRFSFLLNDINIYNMKLEQFQVNIKFLNTLSPEWSKFMTDVKLVWDLHTTNVDQLHAYLGQHEFHAYEVRLMHERNSDPLALVATHQMTQSSYQTHQNSYQNTQFQQQVSPYPSPQYGSPYQSQQYSNIQSSIPLSITYPSNNYQSPVHHNVYSPSSSIPQLEYVSSVNQQLEFSQPNSGLIVLVFQKVDDLIDAINHIMGDKFLLLWVQVEPILQEQVEAILGNKGLLFATTAKGKAICPNSALNLRGNRMILSLRTKRFALMANLSHYGSDALVEAAVQNSNSSAQQDALILSVIEQLKTQVVNCTKINLDNKSVNDTLTAELERYKEQVKVLKEGRNVDLKSKDNISDSCAQSVKIDHLKQTLSEHLKEKESLMQTKAQQLEPKLYDGNVIKNTSAIVIPDSEETLILAEESHSKMLLKQQDPMMLEKKVNTTPVDYVNYVNSPEPTLSSRPTIVEVPKELPKVSMVNMSLKKLKHHFVGFNVVVKERTMSTAKTEGSWGKDIVNIIVNSSVNNSYVNVHECEKCLKLKNELLNKKDFIEKEIYDKLFKSFTTLEKHCISLEVDTQLNQEIFQRDNSVSNQSAPSFDQLFELNELKAQSQEKDTVIKKLKERYKSLSGKINEVKIKKDLEEIETINIELDHRVSKLITKNGHLKQTYKKLYDSIKPAPLKDDLRKLKGKALVDNAVTKHPSDPEMLQINMEPITPKLLNKRTTHFAYIKHTQEEATVLRDLVDHVKANYPLDHSLESACRYTKLIQELLTKISKTCPSINNSSEKLMVMTPKKKDKRVRFTEPVASSGNTITKIASTSNLVSNKPMLSSTGVKPSTSASGSQPSSNTKKDKIRKTPSSTQKNTVEAHLRKVKSSLKNKDCIVAPKGTANVQHSKLNANSELQCVKCNGCMLSDNRDLYVLDFINNVNARVKSKFVKKSSKRNLETNRKVPLRKPTALYNETSKPVIKLVYTWKPRKTKTNVPISKSKVVQIVLWYLDSGYSKHITGDRSQLTNFVNKFLGTVKFRNDHVAKILGYGDYQIGNVTISRVYYVEELGHNLFSLGQFCDSNLEVVFRQHTCFIRNLEGVDLLTGSRGNNMYTLSLGDMMASSPICLLSKASKTKRNHTLIEAARTMLIYAKAPLFWWAEAVATACYTQNRSIIRLRHGKTPYELLHDKPPDLSFFYVFGALCYPTNDSENLDFDELTAMASEHSSLRPTLHEMIPVTISSGLVPNPPPSTTFVPPSRTD
ncbi:retrovirus-related pol polyprotein from transposon TNT 1-94 [Tanacetum coccineum]